MIQPGFRPFQGRAGMWTGLGRWLRRSLAYLRSPRLRKWLILGALIGVVAGFAAVLLFAGIGWVQTAVLGGIAGFQLPAPLGEGTGVTQGPERPWALPLVVGGGALVAGLLMTLLAPDAAGPGNDQVVWAFHRREGLIRLRAVLVKLVATALTIGSGGSAGREGPIAFIGGGVGSTVARWLGLSVADRRTALAAGMGAGIGAIFRAPLAGAVLGVELLYRRDIEAEAMVPSFVASVVAFSIYSIWFGLNPIFGPLGALGLDHPLQLAYYVALGLLAALLGMLFAWLLGRVERWCRRSRLPLWLRTGLVGVAIGAVGMAVPSVLGTGYGWLQIAMQPDQVLLPVALLVTLPLIKIAATGLLAGSGGSAGVFGPGLVIGGFTGAALWHLTSGVLPGVPATPAPFVLVGMLALLGGIGNVPLAALLMVVEMTGGFDLLLPAMVAVAVSWFAVGQRTLFPSQEDVRADSPAHRLGYAIPVLHALRARSALTPVARAPTPGDSLASAGLAIARAGAKGLPVVRDGVPIGLIALSDLGRVAQDRWEDAIVADHMTAPPVTVHADLPLDDALNLMSAKRISQLPVVSSDDGRLLGLLTMRGVLAAYEQWRQSEVHATGSIAGSEVVLKVGIRAVSPVAGRAVRTLDLPEGALLVAIERPDGAIVPHGDTVLEPGDIVHAVAAFGSEEALLASLTGGVRGAPAADGQRPCQPDTAG